MGAVIALHLGQIRHPHSTFILVLAVYGAVRLGAAVMLWEVTRTDALAVADQLNDFPARSADDSSYVDVTLHDTCSFIFSKPPLSINAVM